MSRRVIEWFVCVSGGIIAITVLCIVVGVFLEKVWGINTLCCWNGYAFFGLLVGSSRVFGERTEDKE